MFTRKWSFVFALLFAIVVTVAPVQADEPPTPTEPITITDLTGKEASSVTLRREDSPFEWLPEGPRFTGRYLEITGIVRFDGKTWVSTNWGGLTAFSDDGSWEKAVGLPSERIQWLGVLPLGGSGILTVGSEKGLSFFWSWHDPQEWVTWTSADWGGSCDSVTAVAYRQLQDHGEIWLGTEAGGVFRYDGETMEWTNWRYWPRWEGAEPQETISAINIAEDGAVLVAATYGGTARYYEEDWSFFHDVPAEYAWDIIEWEDQIWIAWGHNYLGVSGDDGQTWKTVSDYSTLTRGGVIGSVVGNWPVGSYKIKVDATVPITSAYVVFEGAEPNGRGYYTGYWFRPSSEGVYSVSPALREDLSGGTEVFGATRNLGRGPISLGVHPVTRNLVVGTYADGFSTFDGQTWGTITPKKGMLIVSNVQAMAFDGQTVVVGGNGGFATSEDAGESWGITTVAGGGMPVPGMVSDIYVDNGEVWTATEEGILWSAADGSVQLLNKFNTEVGYNDNWYAEPMAAARDQYGRLWVAVTGDSDSYVVVLDENESRQFEFEYYSFNSIAFDEVHKKVIVGSRLDGLVIFDVGSETISYVLVGEERLLPNNIRDVDANAGRIAIATSHGYPPIKGGVSISDDGGETWQNFPEVGPVDLVAVGPDGAVYAAGPTPDPTDDYSVVWMYKKWWSNYYRDWIWKSFGITTPVRSLTAISNYVLLGTELGLVRVGWDLDIEFVRWEEPGIVTAIDCGEKICWLSSWEPGFYDEQGVWHEDKSHLVFAPVKDLLPTPPVHKIYLPLVLNLK